MFEVYKFNTKGSQFGIGLIYQRLNPGHTLVIIFGLWELEIKYV